MLVFIGLARPNNQDRSLGYMLCDFISRSVALVKIVMSFEIRTQYVRHCDDGC